MDAEKTKVIILSQGHKIEGVIDLIPGARLTDYMNSANRFIALTDARIFDRDSDEVLNARFVNVLVDNIEVIIPSDDLA